MRRRFHLLCLVLLIILPLSAVADEPPADGGKRTWRIEGDIPGRCRLEKANLQIRLDDVSLSGLSEYREVWPTTGGRRVMVYFDTDPSSRGAEYCGFLYRRALVLKRASSPGFFNITVDAFPLTENRAQASAHVPAELLKQLPARIWTVDPLRQER